MKNKAKLARQRILKMVDSEQRGHIGGSLSCVEILISLHESMQPSDCLIFSKGHAAEGLFSVMSLYGEIDKQDLDSYGKDGCVLGGCPDIHTPGITVSSGSLGCGLGQGAGLAYANRYKGYENFTFVVLGDGECYEGSIWEAAMFASHHRLGHLVAIIDRNLQSVLGYTERYNKLEPFAQKWEAFGWEAWDDVDGHDAESLNSTLDMIRENRVDGRPTVIIASTIKGKGVSFMEGHAGWHHTVPKGALMEQAKKDLGV